MPVLTALLVTAALHAGFQLVVTVVVYPALAEVPGDRWAAAHDAHGSRISLLVAPLYLALVVVGAGALLDDPAPVVVLAVASQAVAVVVTAAVAAPTHGRLGRHGPTPDLLRRLLFSDRVRCAAAVLGLVAAVIAYLG